LGDRVSPPFCVSRDDLPWPTDTLKERHGQIETLPFSKWVLSITNKAKEKEFEEEYEVDQVLDYDQEKNGYLVSWKGYGQEDSQWEPAEHLRNAPAEYCVRETGFPLIKF
jgi:hypothetical protein